MKSIIAVSLLFAFVQASAQDVSFIDIKQPSGAVCSTMQSTNGEYYKVIVTPFGKVLRDSDADYKRAADAYCKPAKGAVVDLYKQIGKTAAEANADVSGDVSKMLEQDKARKY